MFEAEHIYKVGVANCVGGALALVIGTAAWFVAAPNTPATDLLLNSVITFVAFGLGWFALRLIVTAQLHMNLRKGQNWNKTDIEILSQKPEGEPTRRGVPFMTYEVTRIVLALVLVVLVTFLLSDLVGISLGGFVGGWLAGSGAGKLSFARRIRREQQEQNRVYYFSDADLGPYTEVRYYSPDAVKETVPEPAPLKTGVAPAVKRPVRTSAKIKPAPLVSTGKDEEESGSKD